jgi:hypothetical protein
MSDCQSLLPVDGPGPPKKKKPPYFEWPFRQITRHVAVKEEMRRTRTSFGWVCCCLLTRAAFAQRRERKKVAVGPTYTERRLTRTRPLSVACLLPPLAIQTIPFQFLLPPDLLLITKLHKLRAPPMTCGVHRAHLSIYSGVQ